MNEKREYKLKEYYDNPNICLCCGKIIKVKEADNISDVKRKRFCNSSCSAKYNNKLRKPKPKKYCLSCNEELTERHSIYCDNKCHGDYNYKEYIKRWKNGEESGLRGTYQTSSYLKRYFVDKHNGECCKCGWHETNMTTGNVPLELHHIDGNYLNNKEVNLELLCPNCHSLTSTYKNSNTGKGRKDRYKYSLYNN